MSVSSIDTDSGAYIASQSLNATSSALASALTSVNQQFGTANGFVATSLSSFTSISDSVNTVTSASAQTGAAADSRYLDRQVTFNNGKIDSLNSGLGSLVDVDLPTEAAILQSLQIKQQLGAQALSIANQAPQSLLSLFK